MPKSILVNEEADFVKKAICFIENKMYRSKNTKCLKMLHGVNKDEKHFLEKRKIALRKNGQNTAKQGKIKKCFKIMRQKNSK